jgi:hypothetical protein
MCACMAEDCTVHVVHYARTGEPLDSTEPYKFLDKFLLLEMGRYSKLKKNNC